MDIILKNWMLDKELKKFKQSSVYNSLSNAIKEFGYPDRVISAFYGMDEKRIKVLYDSFIKYNEIEALKAFLLYGCKI